MSLKVWNSSSVSFNEKDIKSIKNAIKLDQRNDTVSIYFTHLIQSYLFL